MNLGFFREKKPTGNPTERFCSELLHSYALRVQLVLPVDDDFKEDWAVQQCCCVLTNSVDHTHADKLFSC